MPYTLSAFDTTTFPLKQPCAMSISPLYWGNFVEPMANLGTHKTVATYLGQLLPAIGQQLGKPPETYLVDPKIFKKLNVKQTTAYLETFVAHAQRAECIHLQHEFSVFSGAYLPHQGIQLFSHLLTLLAKQNLSRPVFTTFHQPPTLLQHPLKLLEQQAWKMMVTHFKPHTVHWAICHHPQTYQALIESGFSSEKVCFIPYFVSKQTMQQYPIKPQLSNEVKQRLKLKPTDTLLGVVGFMSPAKRFEDAIKALSFLPNNYKLLMIGGTQGGIASGVEQPTGKEASYESQLVQLIYDSGLENRVLITGLFLNEDLPSYLDCVNLLLAPYSHAWAASGGAASLLLAAKKPIIASNCPAFLAVQHQSQCLALFEAEVVEDLVHTIKQLTASPKEQAFLVTALNRYAQDHCEQSIAQVLLQTYAMAKTTLLTQAIQQET